MMSNSVIEPLQVHLRRVKYLHQQDLDRGHGSVYLSFALARKFPHIDRQWIWQYVFPSGRMSKDPRSEVLRRHHLDESGLPKVLKQAVRMAGIQKRVSCHTFATQLLQNGAPSRNCWGTKMSKPR